jgi:hypothetical protein
LCTYLQCKGREREKERNREREGERENFILRELIHAVTDASKYEIFKAGQQA